jgi:flagellar biosynthesis protein FlhG
MELTRSIDMDQAEGLRTLMEATAKKQTSPPSFNLEGEGASLEKWPRVIAVSSGKGGVGKTNVVANLAFALTRLGKKVLVWDADLGLANIDILLGLTPRYTIEHLLSRKKNMREILIEGPGGMTILPAGSGVLELADLNESQKLFLLNELEVLAGTVDFLLIDTGAGISSNVLYFNMAAEESIVLVTPEPTSITDAYALMKVLSKKYQKKRFTILVNSARSSQEAKEVFRKISRVADRFLGNVSLDYVGFIPFDEKLPVAVKHQRPVLEIFPQALSSRSFMEVTRGLMDRSLGRETHGNLQFFWRYLLQCQQPAAQQGGIE